MRAKRPQLKGSFAQSMFRWSLRITVFIVLLSWCGVSRAQTTEENNATINITVSETAYTLKFTVDDPENYEIVTVTCKSLKNADQLVSEENTCENLEPCTAYMATLVIKVLSDGHEEQTVMEASTLYVEPTVNITEVVSGVDQINLTWTATDKTCISAYVINVVASYKDFKFDFPNDRSDFSINGLKPCQQHNITFKTMDVNNKIVSNLEEISTTERIEPGYVTGITVDTTYETGHAKVLWNQPDYNTCINYYYLKWFTKECESEWRTREASTETAETENPDDNTCSWFVKLADYNAKEYTINGLQGCETYGVQIFIDNEINPSSDVEHFTAMEEVPGIVTALPAEINASQVTLYWSLPKTNAKCVDYYEVIVLGPTQKEQVEKDTATEDRYAKFDDLEPCGSYSYSVQPVSKNTKKGETMSSIFETLEDKPTAVRHLQLHPEANAINVTWAQPDYANLCIKEYRLTMWKNGKGSPGTEDITTTADVTNANISELISCQSYTVQIIPSTINADDGEPRLMETETLAEKPQSPDNTKVTSLFSDGIELTLNYYSQSNCETIFGSFECHPNNDAEKKTKKSAERTVEGKLSGSSFKALVAPLSPFTEYTCTAKLYNIAGYGPPQIMANLITKQYYAETPENISLTSKSVDRLEFAWQQPKFPNGNINVYVSHFQRVRAEYFVPPNCPPINFEPVPSESSSREKSFTGLQAFTRYSIQVAAKNEYGVGEYTRPFMALTDPAVSDPVTNLKITPQGPYASDGISGPSDTPEYHANALVSWTIPCKSNGQILSFELTFHGARSGDEYHFQRSVKMSSEFENDGVVVYNETSLKPEYKYRVGVVIRTEGVDAVSVEESESFDSPAGIPKRFNETTANMARVRVYDADNPTNSAIVRFPASILESEAGEIMYCALLISQKGCNKQPPLQFGALVTEKFWPDSRKWSEVYSHDESCIPQYQTTKMRWEPKSDAVDGMIEYTIGAESCSLEADDYCNGPLKPDTEFYLVIRLFTKSGYNDVILLDFRTESLIQLELILISISCCLLFALIAGFIFLYLKKRTQWKRQSCHDIEDPFGDIISKNFATYYNAISRPERIAREFKELTMVAMEFSYAASELGSGKNRYADIYPYDKNRVILDIDADGSDYINASFIDGYRLKKQYIATQGPKPESTLDFWRMVLQHNIRVIVMLTQFSEGEIVKCHEYFPYKSKGINVIVKKKETFELYDRREMSVTHDRYGLKQKVVHFYFKKWPDHGVPVDPAHLISFVRKVKAEKVPSYSSIVVHCSAGVGRTGTFIGLDIIMQRIKNESKINIYGTVKKLRFQRMKMVQTLEQYTFLYKCAYELVKHKDQRDKMKQEVKKVSFQDDTEANTIAAISTLSNGPSSKSNGRIVSQPLSAIEELENEGAEVATCNGNLNRGIPNLRLNYSSSPALGNGLTKNLGDPNDTNESIM